MSTRLKIIDFEIEIKPFSMHLQTIRSKLSCSFFKNVLITSWKVFPKLFIETVGQVEKLRLRVVTYPNWLLIADQRCIIANTEPLVPNCGAHKTSFYATRNSNGSILKVKTSSLLEFVIVHDFYDPSVIPLFTHSSIYGTVALDVLPRAQSHHCTR